MIESTIESPRSRKLRWGVIFIDGHLMDVPRNKCRDDRESIKKFGMDALLMRISKTTHAKKLMRMRNIERACDCVHLIIKRDERQNIVQKYVI